MSLQEWKSEFENKKIIIWGFGLEGKASYDLIRRLLPEQQIAIADSRKGRGKDAILAETVHTDFFYEDEADFASYDMVLKSPGIVVPEGVSKDNITGEVELFLKHYKDQCIGITGTKGKSTTTSLTYHLLKKIRNTVLAGNIGIPCFQTIDEMEDGALCAFELSCHQLEYCRYSPHIAVYLNLYEEHLDHYGTFENYAMAKANILLHQDQDDICIVSDDLKEKSFVQGRKPVWIGEDIYARKTTLHIPEASLEIRECSLIGEHNYQNLAVAWYIAKLFGIEDDTVLSACKTFQPLHHRLEDLGEYEGVRYVNDSISTIGQACIQALNSLDKVDTVLVGGMDRGIDYSELEEDLAKRDVQVIFMYATGRRIHDEMEERGLLRDGIYTAEDLKEAVTLAKMITKKGHTCLLSPAASSYDHFKNFEERGRVFEALAFEKE
jgi:UDP-N-acetylmuramoylalanine--D-glutamate ligase